MTTSRSTDEARTYYTDRMGEQLGSVYYQLWQELTLLYSKWNEYVTIFGMKASRVDLVNSAAPYFFRVAQDALWENTILHIARMTDPPRSAGKTNLSVSQLPSLVNDPKLSLQLEALVEEAKNASKFCRDWRNRRIAHSDLDLMLKTLAKPLTPGSREKVKNALQVLSNILDLVSTHYLESSTMFDMGANHGGGELLLRVIDEGLRAEEARRQRILEGKESFGNFKRTDL